ncbi:MAG: aminodeoxychorismate synthase, component [Proteobacteria bacterium]|nr:aminodeoxychorismate synthase, component [Pseudomonadota bacterium]
MPRWFDHPFALFEDNLHKPGQLCLLEELLETIHASRPEEILPALQAIERAQQAGHWLAFAARYELGTVLEEAFKGLPEPADESRPPLLQAWVFGHRRQLSADAIPAFWQAGMASLTPAEQEACVLCLKPSWDEARHAAALERILEWIHAGDCYQVNLTFPFYGQAGGHPLALFARLREVQAVAHGALMFDGADWILSRSPELFVAREGNTLTCRPMKGTAARSIDPVEDAARASALQHSAKDRAENLMIVDLIRNDLGRLAPTGKVQVKRLFELETFETIHQLTSTVSAHGITADLGAILKALFPCGSITGAPKIRAMQIIRELEGTPRGLYCGALGWLAPDGNFSLNVPIRTLLLDAQGQVRLDAGSGIVADSQASAEYQECLTKADFVRRLDAGLVLIETLRWEAATGYHLLDLHIERLSHSAQSLGFILDPGVVYEALQTFAQQLSRSPQRVRLTLNRAGQIAVQASLLDPVSGIQKIALAPFRLHSGDPRLRYKTSARRFYDKALNTAQQGGLFDLIFCNERDELCEGARSNLFLELDAGPLLTPALSCGLLPGVLRAHLLAQGRAIEAVLHPDDLGRARRIWLGNALRGLVEVRISD